MKTCSKCSVIKPLSEFRKNKQSKDGYTIYCKQCCREKDKAYRDSGKKREANQRNATAYKEVNRRYNQSVKGRQRACRFRENNRISCNLRYRISDLCRGIGRPKSKDLLGCSWEEFESYISRLFLPGMSWRNYGLHGWHIDHIKPCSSFNLSDPKQIQECFHYSNLQPMWAKDNLSKGNKLQ